MENEKIILPKGTKVAIDGMPLEEALYIISSKNHHTPSSTVSIYNSVEFGPGFKVERNNKEQSMRTVKGEARKILPDQIEDKKNGYNISKDAD